MQKRWQKWSAVAPVTLALALLAGCQTAATTNPLAPEQNVAPGGKANVLPNGNGGATGGATGNAQSGSQSASTIASQDALNAAKSAALEGASARAFTAANGGQYVSDDGSLTATIPPGALTQDASIKIAPIDPTRLSSSSAFVPAILFTADLGGATLQPGTAISVTMRVASDFVTKAKANDPNFTPQAYNMSQDAQGNWMMTMQIKGPAATMPANATPPATAPTAATSPWLLEFGQLGLPGSANMVAANGASYALLDTCSFPLWLDGFGESNGLWGCGQCPHDELCWDQKTPPTVTLTTTTTWASDDSSLNGKPADGANVRFNYSFADWLATANQTGPADEPVSATSGGQDNTWAYEGTTVQATPYSLLVGASGNAVSTFFQTPPLDNPQAAEPTHYTASLSIPNYNPYITFSVTNSEVTFGSTATIAYKLDGVAKTLSVPTGALSGKTSGSFSFYLPLATDSSRYGAHALTITSVSPTGDEGEVSTLNMTPSSLSVRVNGRYSESGNVISIVAK